MIKGLLHLSDSGQYLLASDDTTETDTAMLFLMSADGAVDKSPVLFDGLETMTDIESLSEEGGGALWKFEPGKNSLRETSSYDGVQPEGLAADGKNGELLVVFDQGEDPALFSSERY